MKEIDLLKRLDNIRDELIQTANRHPAAARDLRDIEPWVQEVREGVRILRWQTCAPVESFHLAFGDGHETKHLLAALDRIIPQDRKE